MNLFNSFFGTNKQQNNQQQQPPKPKQSCIFCSALLNEQRECIICGWHPGCLVYIECTRCNQLNEYYGTINCIECDYEMIRNGPLIFRKEAIPFNNNKNKKQYINNNDNNNNYNNSNNHNKYKYEYDEYEEEEEEDNDLKVNKNNDNNINNKNYNYHHHDHHNNNNNNNNNNDQYIGLILARSPSSSPPQSPVDLYPIKKAKGHQCGYCQSGFKTKTDAMYHFNSKNRNSQCKNNKFKMWCSCDCNTTYTAIHPFKLEHK